jgi:CRAL/TRIO domain
MTIVKSVILLNYFLNTQDNYPEVLQKAFVVPANSVTRMLFYGASALMDERSREKFSLIRGDDTNWWKSILPENVLSPSSTKSKEGPRVADMPNRYSIDNYGYQVQY